MADFGMIRQRWNRVQVDPIPPDDEAVEPSPSGADADGTFIGSEAVFEGTLTLKGDFRIDTEFRGELETDGLITVGPNGSVVGTLRGREIVIGGAVMGDVYASRQIIVESTGKLHGDIETACLEIQKHAFFRGKTNMIDPRALRRPAVAADLESSATPTPS